MLPELAPVVTRRVPLNAPRRTRVPQSSQRDQTPQVPPPAPLIRTFPAEQNPAASAIAYAPCINGTVTVGQTVTWDGRDYEVTGVADNGRNRAIAHIKSQSRLVQINLGLLHARQIDHKL